MNYQRLLDLTEKVLILRGSAVSGKGGGFKRIGVKPDADHDETEALDEHAIEFKSLLDLTEDILALRGGPTSGNWAHDGRPGKKGGSGRGGGFKRLKLAKGTTSRPDVVGISRRVRKKRKQLKDKGLPPGGKKRATPQDKKKDIPIKTKPGEGKRVSEGLDLSKFPKSGKVGPDVRAAVDIINQVHSDGDLPGVPVKSNSAKKYLGMYTHSYAGNPIDIKISTEGDHPRITAAHEIGHYLDHQGIGIKGVFTQGRGMRSAFGNTEEDKRLEGKTKALYDALGKSEAIRVLRNDVPKQKITTEYTVAGTDRKGTFTYTADTGYVKYLLEPREQFARAYSQYIADKSGDTKMKSELDSIRANKKEKNRIYYHDQWDDDDFKPISKAFDDLFLELNWVKGE
jgi:hypothetical protein